MLVFTSMTSEGLITDVCNSDKERAAAWILDKARKNFLELLNGENMDVAEKKIIKRTVLELTKRITQGGLNITSGSAFSMVGPVHFQPLELELDQVKDYINGRTLNAGCGERDISSILKGLGADSVTNYDIQSSIPDAILGSLTETPFESDSFDTIFCNAVLEHVPDINKVMYELTRILKPAGYMIIGMPFLQPYHQCPTDFRRYTKEGLVELGEMYRLSCQDILPVHSIAQTLGWITWEWAKEKGRLRMLLVFPLIWLATRLFYRTDTALVNNANTYQIIYRK